MAKFTKQAIMYGFMEILQEKLLDKITVKDICEYCDINRNTFYYYYDDIYDVLSYIFQYERESVLKKMKKSDSFLEEYKRSAAIILNNKRAVINIYQSKRGDILESYLDEVIKDFVRRAVIRKAEGYNLSEEDIKYITCFYSYSIVGNTMRWIAKGMQPYKEDLPTRIAKSFDATIMDLIEMCK